MLVLSVVWQASPAKADASAAQSGSNLANFYIIPPQSESFAQTYGEWGARWWQWVQSMPKSQNPATDTASCQLGQWGPVFFLAGTFTGEALTRSCNVPAGEGLFFPIVNAFCAVSEDGDTAAAIAKLCREQFIDKIDLASLKLTIDGVRVFNLDKFRGSEFFSLASVAENVSDQACGTPGARYVGFRATAYSDGYWAMLRPLPIGHHVVHFEGSVPAYSFTVNVTYQLNVVKLTP
jgi:hypothetical protein